jgi:hypothetical protein
MVINMLSEHHRSLMENRKGIVYPHVEQKN